MTEIDGGPRRLAPLLGIAPAGASTGSGVDEAVLQALDIDIRGVGGILQPAGTPARQVSATEMVDMWVSVTASTGTTSKRSAARWRARRLTIWTSTRGPIQTGSIPP
jgi:hypothetical protein